MVSAGTDPRQLDMITSRRHISEILLKSDVEPEKIFMILLLCA